MTKCYVVGCNKSSLRGIGIRTCVDHTTKEAFMIRVEYVQKIFKRVRKYFKKRGDS